MFNVIVDLIDQEHRINNIVDTLVVMLNECAELCKESVTINKKRSFLVWRWISSSEKYKNIENYGYTDRRITWDIT